LFEKNTTRSLCCTRMF